MSFKNIFNPDFQDFIQICNRCKVDYILVGGYLVILHGYQRTTGDIDIWVNVNSENYNRLMNAFAEFGLPTNAITQTSFLNTSENEVFSFGVSPVCIDIMTSVKGLSFDEAFNNARWYEIEDNLSVRGLSRSDLLKAKKASGRNKDLDDIENLSNA